MAVLDDQGRLRLKELVEDAEAIEPADREVEQDERRDDHEAASEGAVEAGHRRLHGVCDQQHQHQVVERELPDLPLAEEAKGPQQRGVDDHGTDNEFPGRNAKVEHCTPRFSSSAHSSSTATVCARSLIGGGVTKYHTRLMVDIDSRLRHRSVSRSLTPWRSARSAAGGRWAGSPWQRWARWSPESCICGRAWRRPPRLLPPSLPGWPSQGAPEDWPRLRSGTPTTARCSSTV